MTTVTTGTPLLTHLYPARGGLSGDTASKPGILSKTLLLLALVAVSAFSFVYYAQHTGTTLTGHNSWVLFGFAFVVVMGVGFGIYRKPEWGPALGPLFAIAEGIFAGSITAVAVQYTGSWDLPMLALGATFVVFFTMYVLYSAKIIRPTKKFVTFIFVATASIGVFYLVAFVLSIAGVTVPLINSNSPAGIIFSVVVILIAALGMIVDFGNIDQMVGVAPKAYEWALSTGLVSSLVWLYIEILRLLLKIYGDN